tara:strand:- start:485 stop:781 length:297 start_codon:yes stop_codon:yes gene_type:complete
MLDVKTIEKNVDRVAELAAQIAELNAEKKQLTEELKNIGEGKYYGTEHYLTVSLSERGTLNMKAVRAKLTHQFITAHTQVTESLSVTVRGYHKEAKVA